MKAPVFPVFFIWYIPFHKFDIKSMVVDLITVLLVTFDTTFNRRKNLLDTKLM